MPRDVFDPSRVRFRQSGGAPVAYRPNELLVEMPGLADPTRRLAVEDLIDLILNPPLRTGRELGSLVGRLIDWVLRFSDGSDGVESSELTDLLDAVRELRDDSGSRVARAPRLRFTRAVNPKWSLFEPEGVAADTASELIDPLESSRSLRTAGVVAQPNYVRFVNSLGIAPNYIAPNYIAPNYIAPNYIAPNYIAPNYIAPNYIAPNYIAPNYIAPNYIAPNGAGAGGACCACPDAPHVEPEVSQITASPAFGPLPGPGATAVPEDFDAQIHVLDVRFQDPGPPKDFRTEADGIRAGVKARNPNLPALENRLRDEVRTATYVNATQDDHGPARALLPLGLSLREHLKDVAGPNADANFARALDRFLEEPTSPGEGANVNGDNYIDPTVNHAEFIQGIIDRIVLRHDESSCVRHHAVAGTLGDVSDEDLVRAIDWVVEKHSSPGKVRIMNLSLSGYTDDDEVAPILAEAVEAAQENGWWIVASAGNNASCRLAWPAALKDVVAVSAYGPTGPAWFSNYGPWVDASGPGVGVISNFTGPADQALVATDGIEQVDAGDFGTGWASWSGTSFAAPYVAATIVTRAAVIHGRPGNVLQGWQLIEAAVHELLGDPDLVRFPQHGAVVSSDRVSVTTQIDRTSNRP